MFSGYLQLCLEHSSFWTQSDQGMVTYGMEGAGVQGCRSTVTSSGWQPVGSSP